MTPEQRDQLKIEVKEIINNFDGDGLIVLDEPDNLAEWIIQLFEDLIP